MASRSMAAFWTGSFEHSVSYGQGGEKLVCAAMRRIPLSQLRAQASGIYWSGEGGPLMASRITAVPLVKRGVGSTDPMLHVRVLEGFVEPL